MMTTFNEESNATARLIAELMSYKMRRLYVLHTIRINNKCWLKRKYVLGRKESFQHDDIEHFPTVQAPHLQLFSL